MKPSRTLSLAVLTGLLLSACGGTQPTNDTEKPTVSLTVAPTELTANGVATFKATASDNVGVKNVSFYDGDKLLYTDTEAPFEYSQNYTASENGTRVIKAMAVDAAGNQGSATATLSVKIQAPPTTDTEKPTVSLTVAPTELTANGVATFKATASDNVGVKNVSFYDGDKLLYTDTEAPFEYSQNYTASENGTRVIKAMAVDAAGNQGSATATLSVKIQAPPTTDTEKPTVTLAATPQTLMFPGDVKLVATATDNVGVTKVTFYRGNTELSQDTTAPFEVTDSLTAADNGNVTYYAVAQDAAGNTTKVSTNVQVDVDVIRPVVGVTATPSTLNLPGTVELSASATDDRGITRVEFYDNGKLFKTDIEAPYTASRSYAYADNGQHAITVKAYDKQGNVGQSSTTVTVAIADAFEPNNSLSTAAPLGLGVPLKGTIAGQGRDFDYFKFDAETGDMLKLAVKSNSVDSSSTLDPYVMILMPDGKTVLEKDDDSGDGLESEIRFNAPQAGTYYVIVTSFDIKDDLEASDDKATNIYQIELTRR